MKNFPIKIDGDLEIDGENLKGKTIWHSRSMAVSVFVFTYFDEMWHVAAIKRGKGCPDYVGCWCAPCGYVDFDETLKQAASRELYEETGLDIKGLTQIGIEDDPSVSERQNVTFRYAYNYYTIPQSVMLPALTNNLCEPDEVEEVKWIPLSDIGNYTWAFNHKSVIFDAFLKVVDSKRYNI